MVWLVGVLVSGEWVGMAGGCVGVRWVCWCQVSGLVWLVGVLASGEWVGVAGPLSGCCLDTVVC